MKYIYLSILSLVVFYIAFLIVIYINQRNLLYHPSENNYLNDKIEFKYEEVWIETEKEIVDEIKSLKVNKTLVVIAHRLSTVKHCDYIFRIENGMIVSQGSYNEVVGNE